MDIDEMIEKLLDMDIVGEKDYAEAERLTHEIAEKCNTIQIVNKTQEQAEQYGKGFTAEIPVIDKKL